MEFLADVTVYKLVYTLPLILGFLSPLVSKCVAPVHAISVSSVVFVLMLWLWLVGVNIVQNTTAVDEGALLIRLAPGLIWIALLLTQGRSPLNRRMLSVMITFALAVPGLMVPFADEVWRACDLTKCGVFDGMLTGLYSSENFMGLQVAFVTVLHLVTFGLRRSLYLLPLSILWLLATESRTAQYALLAALTAAMVLWLGKRVVKTGSGRVDSLVKRMFLTVFPIVFVFIAACFAFTSKPSDFTGRAWVWGRALEVLTGNEVVGLGVDGWVINQQTGLLPSNLGAHSLYIFLFFSGGAIALVVFVLFIRQAMISSLRHDGDLAPGVVLGSVFLVLGLLEVVWNPAAIDGLSWIPLSLVIMNGHKAPSPGRVGDSAEKRDKLQGQKERSAP
ncbi:hypothetical protein E3O11_13205 [Cryobacterium levicorallinum]|uniref:O-antigen ligase domain-containing protein n=1 Tax=Cryobacterium levicorallinum TaxID=995038 RepID=A0A1I3EPB9_9MICO|nr:hypothetical protein [Cryobacterium levicorallinum]TFB82810.1 hypothetical protein E3O11_13205 [Cryobacterium levicorallinum]SFI00738.1 hypothetical protein SAMN05216274_1314 [Cryobacterium levicorallinum]